MVKEMKTLEFNRKSKVQKNEISEFEEFRPHADTI